MALIEKLTPGGNMYPDGGSTFVVLVELFRRLAENRDTRDAAQKTAWEAADASTLAAAKTDATTKANAALASANNYTDNALADVDVDLTGYATETYATAAAQDAESNANTYTDNTFLATPAGTASDAALDAAVDRAVQGGRITPDADVAGFVSTTGSATRAAVDNRVASKGPETMQTWAADPVNVLNPKYGYVKGADNTACIDAAGYDAYMQSRGLYFPEGEYRYNGAGLGWPHPWIHGAGRHKTRVLLGAGVRLFDYAGSLGTLDFGDMTVEGGAGVFRSTNTGGLVGELYRVTNFRAKGYTGAAFENNSVDMPNWKFRDVQMDGANFTTTMGFALSGLTDACLFENVSFGKNRVDIKLRRGGNNAYIRNCDFVRGGANEGVPRVRIWIVPSPQAVNSGAGLSISNSKFGAENMHSSDYHIVYADEGAGNANGDRFPVLDTASAGFINGHSVEGVMVGGITGAAPPLVFSTTPNVRSSSYSARFQGSYPSHVFRFLVPPTSDRMTTDNVIGPISGEGLGVDASPAPEPSNASGFAYVVDPQGIMTNAPRMPMLRTSGTPFQYVKLGFPTAAQITPNFSGAATITAVSDSLGGTDARSAEFPTNSTGNLQYQFTSPTAGNPVWIEFDAAAVTRDTVRMRVAENHTNFHFSRVIRMDANWRRYRFLWTPRANTQGMWFKFDMPDAAGGSFKFGRVRIYSAQEPVDTDGLTVIDGTVYKLSVVNGVLNATAVA